MSNLQINFWRSWVSCIAKIFPSITKKMQRYTIYLFLWNALHVSGGSSSHHQELKTVYTASDTLSNSSISSTTVVGSSKVLTKYPMLYIKFWAPDDGRRNCMKHVEDFTEINKLFNVASCWLCLEMLKITVLSTLSFHYLVCIRSRTD